ncbi:hypothetical protein CORC01_05222 [Colletotrichum orchidophilum]|uniref:Uncharacterized protein n=1 Tax=Colletotrichum orchidophilum TaxID=1209926 RepID=A0A1G4BDL5_9PEZI|nr:uncharacterized protein CORC01_05222 [Colletotrichum orchidophilum]OHE99422.1 hypothetical protein CORC01_05222 [Colletotrichum orchidophilum]
MGCIRRLFAFLEEGPKHASSKGKPSRRLVKAAVAINKMNRKPSTDSFRHDTVVSDSLVTVTQGHMGTCKGSSESVSCRSQTTAHQDENAISASVTNTTFEPENQLAWTHSESQEGTQAFPLGSKTITSQPLNAETPNDTNYRRQRSISDVEPFPLLNTSFGRTLKSRKKVSGLTNLYQSQAISPIEPISIRPEKRRIRQVSVSQLSTVSSNSARELCDLDDNVFVKFPSFEQAGVKQLDGLLEHERCLAQYCDQDEDDHEWGIDCQDIDEAVVSKKRHYNVVNYNAYIGDSVIQQIYEEFPEAKAEDFKTATKPARNLRFGNYLTGTYMKIKSEDGTSKPVKKPRKWATGFLQKIVWHFFPKKTVPAVPLATQ